MFEDQRERSSEDRAARAHALLDAVLVDPATASPSELTRAVEAHGELAAITDGAAVTVMPRWEASMEWALDGSGSPVVSLVNRTGARKVAAAVLRKTGSLAASMPHVRAAAAEGTLPLSHLNALTRARKTVVAELFDLDEVMLVRDAHTLTAEGLDDRLQQWYLAALAELGRNEPDAKPGPETDNDTMTILRGFQGRGIVSMDLTPASLALMVEAIEARIETWRKGGMLTGDDRTFNELVAAALLDLVTDGSVSSRRGQLRPLLIVTATLAALFDRADITGADRDRWQARILGGGPIGKAALRELMEKANISLVVTDDDGEPLYVGRARRLVTAAIFLALLARSGGTCEYPGCHASHHRAHAHHIIWWEHGGLTDIDNLTSCQSIHLNRCPRSGDRGHRSASASRTLVRRRGTGRWTTSVPTPALERIAPHE